MEHQEEAPSKESPKRMVDYKAIFAEEQAKVRNEYPASNFTPGSEEVELLHQRANERAVTGALELVLEEKGLKPAKESLRMLSQGFVSSFMHFGRAQTYDLSRLEMGVKEREDVGEIIKESFKEMPSRVPDAGFDDSRHTINITTDEGKLKIESPLPDYSK